MSSLLSRGFRPASEVRPASEPPKAAERNTALPRIRHVDKPATEPARIRGVDSTLADDIEGAATVTDAKARRGKLVDRTAVLSARVQPETRATLVAYAEEHGTTVSDIMRELADSLALRIRNRAKAPPQ